MATPWYCAEIAISARLMTSTSAATCSTLRGVGIRSPPRFRALLPSPGRAGALPPSGDRNAPCTARGEDATTAARATEECVALACMGGWTQPLSLPLSGDRGTHGLWRDHRPRIPRAAVELDQYPVLPGFGLATGPREPEMSSDVTLTRRHRPSARTGPG